MADSRTLTRTGVPHGLAEMSAEEKRAGREHIAQIAEIQRGRCGTEFLWAPRIRQAGRRAQLAGIWAGGIFTGSWRRISDSHKWPGRWWSRICLYRPWKTVSVWVLLWVAVAVVCAYFLFPPDTKSNGLDGLDEWIVKTIFAAAVGAFVASIWQDGIKSPQATWRIRRRIMAEPEALLRTTIAPQTTKVMELDPPVNTVPRDTLYEELLPGVLSLRKDVQIVVGVPGAGKTTALLDMASVLARIGFVPVLLELRGEATREDLFDVAKKRFEQQVRGTIKTGSDADLAWRWLCRRQRLAILIDDIDQIGFDGEPGFLMRRLLENLATEGQAVIVTARPAGVPSGIAASAISLDPLDFETGVNLVAKPAAREPGAVTTPEPHRELIERWVEAGNLTEAPLYLEALAELTSVGACPDLPNDPKRWGNENRPGRWQDLSPKRTEWNPLWVRYTLLTRFYTRIVDGRVRPSLAIDEPDRWRTVEALEAAALGTLGASAAEARSAAKHRDEPQATRTGWPKRTQLVDFLASDDRQELKDRGAGIRRRTGISQHEAIDTGERLRILDRDRHGDPQFRHRIMQAFLAGRRLARLARSETERFGHFLDGGADTSESKVQTFEQWISALKDKHHPEKLTAHLTLTFAAVHADERRQRKEENWGGIARKIVDRLIEGIEVNEEETGAVTRALLMSMVRDAAGDRVLAAAAVTLQGGDGDGETEKTNREAEAAERAVRQLDPLLAPDPHERRDPDDDLIRLTTAANITALLRPLKTEHEDSERELDHRDLAKGILERIGTNEGAMRWTKLEVLPAISALGEDLSWTTIWERFTRDADYDVRRAAARQLERNAYQAFPALREDIDDLLVRAGNRAANGQPLQFVDDDGDGASSGRESSWDQKAIRRFAALGWVLPAIVSGLSEEMRLNMGPGADPDSRAAAGVATGEEQDEAEARLRHAQEQLEELAALAYEGGHHELEESLAQGFKADAMRHALDTNRGIRGPGWVASNRRLVADVGIPNAESWYARMLLYQALALYAVAGKSRDDTLDVLAHRLHRTRERHPLARYAARLARASIHRAQLHSKRWKAFIWSDDVEDGGRLPAWLDRQTAQLLGDVAVLVDLKEGSPLDRHGAFGYMEELPYCLNGSKNRHEILGTGCPEQCGWGFCPYRAASPDEPEEHRGVGRVFCRGQRRVAFGQRPSWQRRIGRRRMREFWRQMEYKARR